MIRRIIWPGVFSVRMLVEMVSGKSEDDEEFVWMTHKLRVSAKAQENIWYVHVLTA